MDAFNTSFFEMIDYRLRDYCKLIVKHSNFAFLTLNLQPIWSNKTKCQGFHAFS